MGQDLAQKSPAAQSVFDEVSAALGRDMMALCWTLDAEELRLTQNAQLALFTAGLAAWEALKSQGVQAKAFAGHSVGEYAALVASGALALAEGARLVQTRGELMAAAGSQRPGTMAAVLGLDAEPLAALCREVSTSSDLVVVANDNCPGQVVVSGDVDAVERLSAAAPGAGAKRVLPLKVSGAFHSPLMTEPAAKMGQTVQAAVWGEQHTPVYSNVTAKPIEESAAWPGLLEAQLLNPVRWRELVLAMVQDGVTHFVECGSGDVLTGMLRRIDGGATGLAVQDEASLGNAVTVLNS